MNDITALHPKLQEKAVQLKEKCGAQGIYILFSECLRTRAEQDVLYAQGRTTAGSIVTNAKGSTYSSQHQWGIAIDFYIDMDVDRDGSKKDDAFNNSTGLYEGVGAIAKSIGLGWGGDWSSIKDRPHLYAAVIPLQKRLNALGYACGTVDGITGPKFTAAVNSYQKNVLGYKNPDGEVTAGKRMWKSLLGMV